MKYIVCIMLTVIAFAVAPQCYGQGVTVEFYQSQINSKNQTEVLLMKNYVKGALDGIQWANALLINDNKKPLYCPAENLGLGTGNAIQLIDHEIKSMPPKKDLQISLLLLFGLQKAFPCKEK
jgi:hypothetical protein